MLIRYFLLAVFCITGSKLFAQERESNAYLIFDLNVDSAYVQFGLNNPSVIKVASNDTIHVKNGFYHLTLSYPTSEDYYTTQNVLRGSANTITHDFDLSEDIIDFSEPNIAIKELIRGNLVIVSDLDTDIYLDNYHLGSGISITNLTSNQSRIIFQNRHFYHSKTIEYENKLRVVEYYFSEYDKSNLIQFVIPGLYQLKENQKLKATVIMGGVLSSITLSLVYLNKYKKDKNDYNSIRRAYLSAVTEREALFFGEQMYNAAQTVTDQNRRRNIAFLSLVGFIIFDSLDKTIFVKKKKKKWEKVDFSLSMEPYFEKYIKLGATIKL